MSVNSWRLLIHPKLDGPTQMAVDEMLYNRAVEEGRPVLRFYSWLRPALSLGAFQDYKKVVMEPFCVHNNISVVRRLTGGRAVLHAEEVTYAVIAPLNHGPFENRSLQETYRVIAEALEMGLERMGVTKAAIAFDAPSADPRASGGQCFVAISKYEIGKNARKIIGSAQKRSHDRFLQHGSILLSFDPFLQQGCVNHPDPGIESKIAPLNTLLDRECSFEEVSREFAGAFQVSMNAELHSEELSPAELSQVTELETKYRDQEWTRSGCK